MDVSAEKRKCRNTRTAVKLTNPEVRTFRLAYFSRTSGFDGSFSEQRVDGLLGNGGDSKFGSAWYGVGGDDVKVDGDSDETTLGWIDLWLRRETDSGRLFHQQVRHRGCRILCKGP